MEMRTKLKVTRENANLSQDELSEKSGVSQQTISAIEAGITVRPSADTLYKLASALNITTDELMDKKSPAASEDTAGDNATAGFWREMEQRWSDIPEETQKLLLRLLEQVAEGPPAVQQGLESIVSLSESLRHLQMEHPRRQVQ